MDYLILIVSAVLIKNILLAEYLGNCPFLGTSRRMDSAAGMGAAVVFVLTLSAAGAYAVEHLVLEPLGLGYLRTIAFVLLIAALVQFMEMALRRFVPPLYRSLGIYLPLITTNCAVLGVAILCVRREYGFIESVVFAFASACGFALALTLMAGIRERLEAADVPRALRGTAVALITAGLMALAFMGFGGVDASLQAMAYR